MDDGAIRKRQPNPIENAGFLSKITFFFTRTTFQQGLRHDLEEHDIYEIVSNCTSTPLGNRLEKEWEQERKKKRNGKGLLRIILKIFGVQYALLGLSLLIINTCLMIAKPLLIGKIVSYFTPKQTEVTQQQAFFYCVSLIGCIFANTFFMHSYFFALEQLGLRVRTAICALLYRKTLKLSSAFMSKIASGQAVTLITKDVASFDAAIYFVHQMWVGAIQIVVMTYIMYKQIGISAVVGTAILLLFIPFQGFLGNRASTYKLKTAKRTDERVQATQELLTAIKIIKMYTWEPFFGKLVGKLRKKEIRFLRILFYIKAVGVALGQISTRLAFYVCVVVFVALGNHITAEKAFVVTTCFSALRFVLMFAIPIGIAQSAELKASIYRITKYLKLEEVSEFENGSPYVDEKSPGVYFKGVSFKPETDETVLKDVNLILKPGLNVLTGGIAGGKSTLLKLILGDVKSSEGYVEVSGKSSYASQEPWLFPGTIKQNIIFGEWYDQKRYETVIRACALRKDLEALPDGDGTYVTDRGLNLSRGQKARINLARAVYRIADIYLLDDCLSAVDAHVGKHIFEECIRGFLKDKICVLVTHHSQFLLEANNIIVLDGGRVKFVGNYANLKQSDCVDITPDPNKNEGDLVGKKESVENESEKAANYVNDAIDESCKLLPSGNANAAKNIYGETKEEGTVKKEVYFTYFMSGGGAKMLTLVTVIAVLAQATASWLDLFVSSWVDLEKSLSDFRLNQTTNTTEYKELEESHDNMLRKYSFIILATTVFGLMKAFTFFIFCSNVSNNLHNKALNKILSAVMTFFDENLSGNVLNRFSRDLGIIDERMPYIIYECTFAFFILIAVLLMVSWVYPIFLIPSAIFAAILFFARRLYLPTGRSVKRLEGMTRSAVVGHLNTTLEGLTVIRAHQAEKILKKEFDKHQDVFNSATYMFLSTARAFGFYLDILSGFYITIITMTFIFYKTDILAGKVGLAITQSFALTGLLQWSVRQWAELENQMTSAERILEYTKIETEEKSGDTPAGWPLNGRVMYRDVNLRYSSSNERVLKDINFTIESKQKVGIVGRTGAGKSSIISVLFRLYEFRGTVIVDGMDTKNVALEYLRSRISVIPQDPVLFSGTIRSNLDPNDEFSDKEIWDALDEVEMKKPIGSLNSKISEGGANFSIGQRQLICLARAIIRNNTILVLDEATANIDPDTDALIQRTIKKRFYHCTVITIAHKLNTVMDADRILVMDSGMAVEFDHPKVLLSNRNSAFYKMAKESGLV